MKTKHSKKQYIRNPIKVIDEAIKDQDWFSGFANAVTYFEHYGHWAINLHCHRENVELTRKAKVSLKQLSAVNLTLLLRILKLIDNETYSNIRKIIEERNKLVHPGRKGITYRDRKKKDKAVRLLNQAKESVRRIKGTTKVVAEKSGGNSHED